MKMKQEDCVESHSESKYRKNNEKMFGFFYSSILMSIGISISIYGSSSVGYSQKLMAAKVYYTLMYMTSVVIILMLWTYLFINRNKTHEALMKGGNGSFQFLLSKRGEKVNLYLRLGLALFGICSFVYICMATYIRSLEDDEKASIIINGISQALFIAMQTMFILCFHRLVILVHANIMKFALLHLTIVNMLMWANASLGKVTSEFESGKSCKSNSTSNVIVCTICLYLLPTVSEYTVIAAAVIHEIYLRIGNASLIELEQKEIKKTTLTNYSKTLPGVISGILLVLCCVISSISSIVLHRLKLGDLWLYYFHSSQMIALNILGIIFLIVSFIKIRKMKFSVSLSKSSLDKNILFVSYILAINFSFIVSIICGIQLFPMSDLHITNDLKIRLVSSLFEIAQASLQTHFIIECFQRCCYDSTQKEAKPGRNFLAVLLAINVGMWFLWTLQIKNADIIYHKINGEYFFQKELSTNYTKALLMFFLQSTLPLGMLYRYHSSACLSDIYSKIYQSESERFVDHLRSGKLQNENGIVPNDTLTNHKNSNIVSFKNMGYESDDESLRSVDVPYKKRSQSAGIIPYAILKDVKKKMIRRATLKNMEEAQYKFVSEQICHQMLQRKMSPGAALPKGLREEKLFPNVNRMIREGLFSMNLEMIEDDVDNDSAYSI